MNNLNIPITNNETEAGLKMPPNQKKKKKSQDKMDRCITEFYKEGLQTVLPKLVLRRERKESYCWAREMAHR